LEAGDRVEGPEVRSMDYYTPTGYSDYIYPYRVCQDKARYPYGVQLGS